MKSNQESIYQKAFHSIRSNLYENTLLSFEDVRQELADLGFKKDYDEIIARIKNPRNIDNSELLQTLQYAQQTAMYGMDISMIDRKKRNPAQNLRAFIIHLQTKTLKNLSQQLLSIERVFQKAMLGLSSTFYHSNQLSQKNILTISKHLHGIANKIFINQYSIQKNQANKQSSQFITIIQNNPDNQTFCNLKHQLEQYKEKTLEFDARIKHLEKQRADLLEVNKSLLISQKILSQSFERVIKKEEHNHIQIQEFKYKIQEILSLYESQKARWISQATRLKELLNQSLLRNAELQAKESQFNKNESNEY